MVPPKQLLLVPVQPPLATIIPIAMEQPPATEPQLVERPRQVQQLVQLP